jgi:hypothetical protein
MDDGAQNGHSNGKIYVAFGAGETDEMPLEWAARMLTAWRDKNPSAFGKALAEAALRGR